MKTIQTDCLQWPRASQVRISSRYPPRLLLTMARVLFFTRLLPRRPCPTRQGFSTMVPTTDLCDKYYEQVISGGTVRVLAPVFQQYGKQRFFSGPVTTLKVFEDNSLVRAALEKQGDGKVLVVDGGGSLRCALLGGNLAALAASNGWSGILVNGCVRDLEEINEQNVGVRALAPHPLKSFKRGQGEKDVPVVIGGVRILPGEWCYSDCDGVVIADKKL